MDPNSYIADYQVIRKIYDYQDLYNDNPDTDDCIKNIGVMTADLNPRKCYMTSECSEKFYGYDPYATGYILTHK